MWRSGEIEIQTALREVKEETNLEVAIDSQKRYEIKYSPKEGVEKSVIYFLATNITEDIKPQISEIEKIEWFSYKEALKTITFDNTRELFRTIIKEK